MRVMDGIPAVAARSACGLGLAVAQALAALLALSAGAVAAPVIESVGFGAPPDGRFELRGSGFGEKPAAAPILYDCVANIPAYAGRHLRNGDRVPVRADGDCRNCPWEEEGFGMRPVYHDIPGEVRVPGGPVYRVHRKGAFRGPNPVADLDENSVVYLTWWVRVNHRLYDAPGGLTFNKLLRFTAGSSEEDWVEQVEVEPQDVYATKSACGESGWGWLGAEHPELSPNAWHRVELFVEGGGDLRAGSGRADVMIDGVRVAGTNTLYSCRGMLDHVYVWGSDPNVPENYPEWSAVLFGELYIDSSRARVVLTDSDRYAPQNAQPTHWEILPATAWSDHSITVEFHRGTFSPAQRLYLYVIDPNGSVSPPFSLSGGDTGDRVAPAPIDDLAATPVGARSARLAWSAPGDDGPHGTCSGYLVRWREGAAIVDEADWEVAQPADRVPPRPEPAGRPQVHPLNGLRPGVLHGVAVRALDEAGNLGPLGPPCTVTTRAGPPEPDEVNAPAAVTDLTVTGRGPDFVSLEWTAVGAPGFQGAAGRYYLRFRPGKAITDAPGWEAAEPVPVAVSPEPAGARLGVSWIGLAAELEGGITVRAADGEGRLSPIGNTAWISRSP